MPLIWIVRSLFSLLSLVVLVAIGYLLWSWYDGSQVVMADGNVDTLRENWRLWTALSLIAWSLLGRFIVNPLLARPDRERFTPERGDARMMPGVADAQLHVETHGRPDGPTLLLTHGWGLDNTIWSQTRQSLASRFRLISWDLPGMGKSHGRVHLSAFAANLALLVERLTTADEPVVLVGHSIGGMTIQTLARDHPDLFRRRVAGIVLVNTSYTNPLKTMILAKLVQSMRPLLELNMRLTQWLLPLSWLNAWQTYLNGTADIANRIAFASQVTRSQLGYTSLLTTRNSPAKQAQGNLSMFRWDATGALAGLDVPVLVLGGADDIVTKPEASEVIAASARKADLRIIDDANHMGFLERPDVYTQAIADFADDILRRPVPEISAPSARRPIPVKV